LFVARKVNVRRWIGGLVVLLLLVGGLAVAFWPQPVPVDLVTVARGPLTVTVDGEGETRVRDVYVITAPVSGHLLRVRAEAGDSVSAEQTVLATIIPTDPAFLDARARAQAESDVQRAEAALALAEAELNRAHAELNYAQAEFERVSQLAERGTISRAALDRALMEMRTREAAVASREAEVRVRRSELQAARAALIEPGADGREAMGGGPNGACCVQVRSPQDGVVLRVQRESEGVVAAGDALIEVGDPRRLQVVVDLLSSDAVRVRPGAEVILEDCGGDVTLRGQVRRVEPFGFTKVSALGIEEQRVNVLIDLTSPLEEWAALGHGFRVVARIVVWHSDDALSVPIGAVFRPTAGRPGADDWAVFVVEDGRAHLRPVTVGRFTDRAVHITSGLEPGEAVVLHPSDRIADGTRVVRRDEAIG
jgi:HlyD family secretion protein